MAWAIEYEPQAEKELSKLDKGVQRAVKKFLDEVSALQDPASRGHGMTGPMAGLHRYRIGQLRILVKIKRNIVTVLVLTIDKRDSIY